MTDAVTYRESSNPTISQRQVGISNIWARDLPDKNGAVASRVSAQLMIYDPATKASTKEIVYAGSVVAIGADHYAVTSVEAGKSVPGSIALKKQ